jgi:hypothetical protein
MLFSIKSFFSNKLPTVEEWSRRNADVATPDDIIAAAIMQSFAKDFKDWKGSEYLAGDAKQAYKTGQYDVMIPNPSTDQMKTVTLRNSKTGIQIIRGVFHRSMYDGPDKYWYGKTFVDGVELDERQAQKLMRAYLAILKQVQATEEAARQAKRVMDRNEAAWNLAEKLLGMKRNEFGALVPVKTAEADVVHN